jgi:GNAT superfamily N-acetyltransferase
MEGSVSRMELKFETHGIDWQALEKLYTAGGLKGREGDKLRRAFKASTVVCFAMEGDRIIGASRAISDGEYHAMIYDVVVHPSRQRRGIGTRMMRELMDRLRVWRVMLVADKEVAPFYKRFGFDRHNQILAAIHPERLYDAC